MVARTKGMLTHWTAVDTAKGGSSVATTSGHVSYCFNQALPASEPQKMAARAHVMPATVATRPLYGGPKAKTYGAKADGNR
eukprot:scaffold5169_cov172-Amphora_coffeaeformis.AAC.31